MSALGPGIISPDLISLAQDPATQAASRLYVTKDPCLALGEIRQGGIVGSTIDSLTADAGGLTELLNATSAYCIGILASNVVTSDGNGPVEVQIDVTYADGSTGTMTAIFQPASWVDNKDFCLPMFSAKDFIADAAAQEGLQVASVDGLVGITNGHPSNTFEICAFPSKSTDGPLPTNWCEIDCPQDLSGPPPIPQSIPVPCRYNGQKYSVKGVSESEDLTLSQYHFSGQNGLGRFNGQKVTVCIEIHKCDAVVVDRFIYCDYLVRAQVDLSGTGDDLVLTTSTNSFGRFGHFHAE